MSAAGVLSMSLGLVSCSKSSTPPVTPTPAPIVSGAVCGEERWAVKTLSDPDAIRVDFVGVTPTTIAALNGLAPHCSGLSEARTYAEEFRVYEATGLVQITRNEDDRDVHIALADPVDPSKTIVVEVVDPSCAGAAQSPFVSMLSQAKVQFGILGSIVGRRVRVRGVGFYDFAHGQTGRSQSCIELHPVLSINLES
jgi:hypothetical protein